ncbi:hypothetical protein D3C76_616860 [compost metagenome]
MEVLHPWLRAEVLQVQPERSHGPFAHGLDIGVGKLASECLDNHIRRLGLLPGQRPGANLDSRVRLPRQRGIGLGTEPDKGSQVVDPQAHLLAVLARQLAREPPGDADVAIVVDHSAEDIPARHLIHPSHTGRQCSNGVSTDSPLLALSR